MWFDEIMDDCKKALQIAGSRKGIFAPVFIKLALNIMLGLYFVISIIAMIAVYASNTRLAELLNEDADMIFQNIREILGIFSGVWIWVLISYILVLAASVFMDAGVIGLLKAAASGDKPRSTHFLGSVKQSFFRLLGGNVFLQLISLLLSPIIIALFLLVTFTLGILSSGWATIFLSVTIAVFFSIWSIAVVVDGVGPIKAIGMGFRFGKRYFKGLFIILLATVLLTSYLATAFGLVIGLVAGWFILGVVTIFFKLVIMLIYDRKKEELLGIVPETIAPAEQQ